MPYFRSPSDNAQLHYLDYNPVGFSSATEQPPVRNVTLVFLHGWPMSSLMYEHLLLPLSVDHGLRCIAPDRRGFGKSEWTGEEGVARESGKVTYEVFAGDTAGLLQQLNLIGSVVFVAASMGCGESLLVYQMLPDKLKEQCAGFIWLGPSLPFPIATPANPKAPSRELWDSIVNGLRADRTAFVREGLKGVFGTNFDMGVEVAPTVMERFEWIVGQADAVGMEACVDIMTRRNLTEELKSLGEEGGPKVKILHGSHDQGMPSEASALKVQELVPHAEVKMYDKAAHGLYLTHQEEVLGDILQFVSGL